MRWIVWLSLVLVVVGWLAAEMPLPTAAEPAPSAVPWRRTRDGWEEAIWLSEDGAPIHPTLHPAVVATWQLFASMLVLAVFSRGARCPNSRLS
jgi:hypothetical protein